MYNEYSCLPGGFEVSRQLLDAFGFSVTKQKNHAGDEYTAKSMVRHRNRDQDGVFPLAFHFYVIVYVNGEKFIQPGHGLPPWREGKAKWFNWHLFPRAR